MAYVTRDGSRTIAIRDLADWAQAIAELETEGALPCCVVLVRSEAHAHALRVELMRSSPRTLAGTRFLTPLAAARAVLERADVAFTVGEEIRRPLRVRKLLRDGVTLGSFPVDTARSSGWEEAFASTIEQLETGGLTPLNLDELAHPHAADLAMLWRALDADAGDSWSAARILVEARRLVERDPAAWPFEGPVLALAANAGDAAHAAFVRSVPHCALAVLAARPRRAHAIERLASLYGAAAADRFARVSWTSSVRGELGVLAESLFESPERLAAPPRRRSNGCDGTVSIEQYASIAEELDAAARWVSDEVFARRTPLQDIAVLVPNADPLVAMLADRLAALPWNMERAPIYVACGRAATTSSGGARLLALLRAIAGYLPVEAMLEVLPRLRPSTGDERLSPGGARKLVRALATIGGSAARPADALRWRLRVPHLDERLRPFAPPVDALVQLVERVLRGEALAAVWDAIQKFIREHVIANRELYDIVEELDAELRELARDPISGAVRGSEAVELIEQRLRALRIREGRYGEAAIYVGLITEAAGLPFTAVRVLGMAEGGFPGTLREDPILPAPLRAALPSSTIITDQDYAAARLHAFHQVVRAVRERLVISAARTDFDGSEREPAALLVDVAAALARPSGVPGAQASVIPTALELERDIFEPARRERAERIARDPLTPACWLDVVAAGSPTQPSAWVARPSTNPRLVTASEARQDGVLGSAPLTASIPGTEGAYPLSASALNMLLACPHRFLLQRVLGFRPREELPAPHRIDADAYGSLVHAVAARFANAHGAELCAGAHDLEHWLAISDAIACDAFEVFLETYPLVGDGAAEAERWRLRRDVATFVEHEWSTRPRTFVAAEREFGGTPQLSITTAAGPLYVAGRIDRIDVQRGTTIVRDLKTGRARPRERELADPDANIDMQLALYAAVAAELASVWNVPPHVAGSYVYLDHLATRRERSFTDDPDVLSAAGGHWLEIAASLIRDRLFVQTPRGDDCRYCPFTPVCGDVAEVSARRLRDATGGLAAFRELKR